MDKCDQVQNGDVEVLQDHECVFYDLHLDTESVFQADGLFTCYDITGNSTIAGFLIDVYHATEIQTFDWLIFVPDYRSYLNSETFSGYNIRPFRNVAV